MCHDLETITTRMTNLINLHARNRTVLNTGPALPIQSEQSLIVSIGSFKMTHRLSGEKLAICPFDLMPVTFDRCTRPVTKSSLKGYKLHAIFQTDRRDINQWRSEK